MCARTVHTYRARSTQVADSNRKSLPSHFFSPRLPYYYIHNIFTDCSHAQAIRTIYKRGDVPHLYFLLYWLSGKSVCAFLFHSNIHIAYYNIM